MRSFLILRLSQINQTPITIAVRTNIAGPKIHDSLETCGPSPPKPKNVLLMIDEMKVPGRNSNVSAAIVIMEAESRCVCSATRCVCFATLAVSSCVSWLIL